jgi:hypothetical protein
MPRPLLTKCAATAVAAAALGLSGLALAGPAAASQAAVRQADGAPPVSLTITSVSPAFAQPGRPVTVSGTLTNSSSGPMTGLSVQLRSSSTPLGSRGELQAYANGNDLADSVVPGAAKTLPGTLRPGATVNWTVVLPVSQVPMTTFGVYPLAAQAENSSLAPLTVSRTFLPFWPGKKGPDPKSQQIAWIWPLIDQPRQALCAGLLNNGLASSIASGGRLAGLLDVGSSNATSAQLTWAVDPALLANVRTMTKPHRVGGTAGCHGVLQPASKTAAAWLTQLKSATAGQPVFVTPYADVDVAALIRHNLNADLARAYAQGRSLAGTILGRDFSTGTTDTGTTSTGTTGISTASTGLNDMAWPADGIANYAVLENLAASEGIDTVVLDSSTMPPSPQQTYTPSAQTSTPDGEGPKLNVLLSDDTITQVLGTANRAGNSKAVSFSVAQRYLAETAMIAAERPELPRSIVVAPPRHWDPPAGLASALLSDTTSAPWLRPVSLSQLAATPNPPGQVHRQAPHAVSRAALRVPLLTQARRLDQQASLLQNVQLGRQIGLGYGAAALESSAWRGHGAAAQRGSALAQEMTTYLRDQYAKLTIIDSGRLTLGGMSGTVPVSISNRLPYDVKVRLGVRTGSGVTVNRQRAVVIPAGQEEIVKLAVKATAVGSTTLRLSLLSADGTPVPGAHATMTVQATHYGTFALVIIASALAVFLLTVATRAVRRGRRGRPEGSAGQDGREEHDGPGPAPDPGPGHMATGPQSPGPAPPQTGPVPDPEATDGPDRPGEPAVTDNVVPGHPDPGHASRHDPAEETDDYAWAPGWTDRR